MRVLVTGGAGFLGRHFARHYIKAGEDVLVVDDLSNPHSYWPMDLPQDVFEKADIIDFISDGRQVWDIILHFAAPVGGRERIERDPLFNARSLAIDAALFRAATSRPSSIGLVVYPSSSAVYGTVYQQNEPFALREGHFDPRMATWPAPDEVYGLTKMVGEVLAWKAEQYGLDTLCIRPFSGYGEDQSLEYPVPAICRRVAFREDPLHIWGSGAQKRDFIHVDDVVGATLARIEAGVEGYQVMNIGSGTGVSFMELARFVAQGEGYSPTIVVLTEKPQGVPNRVCDPTRMLSFYTPTVSLEEGMARVVRAMQG